MVEKGVVIAVQDNEIQILMGQNPSCGGCTACSVGSEGKHILTLSRQVDCRPGDEVELEISERSPYLPIFSFFVLPLMIMFLMYLVLNEILPSDLAIRSFLLTGGTIAGLLVSVPFIRMIDRYFSRNENKFIRVRQVYRRGA